MWDAQASIHVESDVLIDTMLDYLEAVRTPLPLLQFTAARLWECRDRERQLFTLASHEQLRGIARSPGQPTQMPYSPGCPPPSRS